MFSGGLQVGAQFCDYLRHPLPLVFTLGHSILQRLQHLVHISYLAIQISKSLALLVLYEISDIHFGMHWYLVSPFAVEAQVNVVQLSFNCFLLLPGVSFVTVVIAFSSGQALHSVSVEV